MNKIKSIVVFRSAALGDFIICLPALQKLRDIFPEYRIILITIQPYKLNSYTTGIDSTSTQSNIPWVQLATPHLLDKIMEIKNITSLKNLALIRKELSNLNISKSILMLDPCAPLFGRLKKLLLIYFLVGWKPIYGWRDKGWLNLDKALLKRKGLLRHHVHGPLSFMGELPSPIKYKDDDLKFDLRPSAKANLWAKQWLHSNIPPGKRIIALSPGSIRLHKQWPLSSFKTLMMRLLEKYSDLHIIIIGSPLDFTLGAELVSLAPNKASNLAGVSTINQSAAILKNVYLTIANDGGSAHLADAMGSLVISLVSGIEFPDSIEPWHNKTLAIRSNIECAPCYSFEFCPQGHAKCMKNINVEEVFEKCSRIL